MSERTARKYKLMSKEKENASANTDRSHVSHVSINDRRPRVLSPLGCHRPQFVLDCTNSNTSKMPAYTPTHDHYLNYFIMRINKLMRKQKMISMMECKQKGQQENSRKSQCQVQQQSQQQALSHEGKRTMTEMEQISQKEHRDHQQFKKMLSQKRQEILKGKKKIGEMGKVGNKQKARGNHNNYTSSVQDMQMKKLLLIRYR